MTSIKEALRIARGYIADDVTRKPSEYDPRADLRAIDAALAQLDSADAREVWRKAGDVPQIKSGVSQQYILAVYRKRRGKVYSFAAEYLNDYPLRYDWGCPKDHKGICDGCSEDGCPTTGWYVVEGADDDGYTYHALSLDDGDRIEGWREVPRWEERSEASSLLWSAQTHDEIIKRLMFQVGMPNSMSLYQAFKQFASELHALSTGLLPDSSPGDGAEKVREALQIALGVMNGNLLTASRERNYAKAAEFEDYIKTLEAALHSTSAAGETTSSDGGGCMADFSSGDPNNLKELMAGPSVFDPPSEAADVLAMKEACKRAVSECLNQYGRMTFVTEKGWSGLESQILAAIDKLSPEVKAEGEQRVATVTYTNWRGETSVRRIIPRAVRYGVTAWHPQPQWLMLAWDDDKQANREFALKDFGSKAEGGRGEPVAIKPLEWRDHRPDSFPEPAWSAQTPFGYYNIEEVSASDSPAYVVRLHAHHFIADKDSLEDAKAAAQTDYEQRIRSALYTHPASPPDVEAIGFAVMSFGKINVTTVSPTRRGALVNWLVSSARIPVFQWTTDDEIESSWRQLSGRDHKCAEVSIAALLDGGRKP